MHEFICVYVSTRQNSLVVYKIQKLGEIMNALLQLILSVIFTYYFELSLFFFCKSFQ